MVTSCRNCWANGRTADVYAFGDDRVLRRYRDGSTGEARGRGDAYVGSFGYPVPKVFRVPARRS